MKQIAGVFSLIAGLTLSTCACAELKIGVVNVARVLSDSPQVKMAQDILKQEFEPRQESLIDKQRELQELDSRLKRDAAVMSASDRRESERRLLKLQRDIRREQDELNDDFNLRRNDELAKLQLKVVDVVKEIAKDENYDLVLGEGVIYTSEAIEITGKILDRLIEQAR